MGAMSWLSFGHARHAPSARIQAETYHMVATDRIRISPFPLLSSRNIPSDFSTRTSDSEINSAEAENHMGRIRLGNRRGAFRQ